ncbi:MAG TPA: LLM class flavin-dependent oxidoreductase [Acidimicrobiales bacterium]|nr:LLM class flavin-dependent oxidoreductase [Acidimicrobiales bacterium]
MQIGLALPQYDYDGPRPWAEVVATAERADAAGFHSIWLADHLFLGIEKYGGPAGGHFGLDPVVALGALARHTSTTRLGILVLCAQLRPPKLLVRQLRTLQELAGGRLVPGAGAGWYEPEYEAAGIPFERPGVRLGQLAELLDLLGEWGLPRLAGGKGDRFLREVVASHADGWNTAWAWTPEAYAERTAVLDAALAAAGRRPDEVERSIGLYTLIGEDQADLERRFARLQATTLPGVVDRMTLDEWKAGRLVGTVEEVRAQVARWRTLGVSVLVAGLGALPFTSVDPDDLDLLASALL